MTAIILPSRGDVARMSWKQREAVIARGQDLAEQIDALCAEVETAMSEMELTASTTIAAIATASHRVAEAARRAVKRIELDARRRNAPDAHLRALAEAQLAMLPPDTAAADHRDAVEALEADRRRSKYPPGSSLAIREWARSNGWPLLGDRGRIHQAAVDAYFDEHPTVSPTQPGEAHDRDRATTERDDHTADGVPADPDRPADSREQRPLLAPGHRGDGPVDS